MMQRFKPIAIATALLALVVLPGCDSNSGDNGDSGIAGSYRLETIAGAAGTGGETVQAGQTVTHTENGIETTFLATGTLTFNTSDTYSMNISMTVGFFGEPVTIPISLGGSYTQSGNRITLTIQDPDTGESATIVATINGDRVTVPFTDPDQPGTTITFVFMKT